MVDGRSSRPPRSGLRVLMGFAEAVAGPEAAFSLLAAGFEVIAFTRAGATPSLRRCPSVRLVEVTSPSEDSADAVRELRSHVDALAPDVVLPLDDYAVWLCDEACEEVRALVAG